jgi:hypothetical protein
VIRPEHGIDEYNFPAKTASTFIVRGLHSVLMFSLPKPRSFWDYALFALMLTGLLVLLFWIEATHGIGWADTVLALAASVLCVLIIVVARRNERAAWIVRPTWQARLLVALGAFLLIFGAVYADGYILHRIDITANRFRQDVVLCVAMATAMFLSLRRRNTASR